MNAMIPACTCPMLLTPNEQTQATDRAKHIDYNSQLSAERCDCPDAYTYGVAWHRHSRVWGLAAHHSIDRICRFDGYGYAARRRQSGRGVPGKWRHGTSAPSSRKRAGI